MVGRGEKIHARDGRGHMTKQQPKPNKHGVLLPWEEVPVFPCRRELCAIIKLAEWEDQWYWGVDIQIGSTQVGANGGGYAPALGRGKSRPTRQGALDAATSEILAHFQSERDSHRKGLLSYEGKIPALIDEGIKLIGDSRQLSLF